ncbi:hypothetical protein GCM10022279_03600 [Comamonas faecalis]|uniref:Uncharacterized protein n=1 Tax=Comamonas faecalis TaxID=1387849 RepID=A0ABP7QJ47_9BURK
MVVPWYCSMGVPDGGAPRERKSAREQKEGDTRLHQWYSACDSFHFYIDRVREGEAQTVL